MKLVLISDTHNNHDKLTIPPCDVLIHCGDCTTRGQYKETEAFLIWFSAQDQAKRKILIAGNHDFLFEKKKEITEMLSRYPNITYLRDSCTSVGKYKIWGSPWIPKLVGWAFYAEPHIRAQKWDFIPKDTDILVTHSPPFGILDVTVPQRGNKSVGCQYLQDGCKATPMLHCFGHIHEAYGQKTIGDTLYVNASITDHWAGTINEPVIINLPEKA